MRKQFTRRGLLKTGIAASAGLIGSNGLAFGSLEAGAAALANEGSS
jgi:hypothetical protein